MNCGCKGARKMPKVNGKKYPYTPKGKAAAKKAMAKVATKMPRNK